MYDFIDGSVHRSAPFRAIKCDESVRVGIVVAVSYLVYGGRRQPGPFSPRGQAVRAFQGCELAPSLTVFVSSVLNYFIYPPWAGRRYPSGCNAGMLRFSRVRLCFRLCRCPCSIISFLVELFFFPPAWAGCRRPPDGYC